MAEPLLLDKRLRTGIRHALNARFLPTSGKPPALRAPGAQATASPARTSADVLPRPGMPTRGQRGSSTRMERKADGSAGSSFAPTGYSFMLRKYARMSTYSSVLKLPGLPWGMFSKTKS